MLEYETLLEQTVVERPKRLDVTIKDVPSPVAHAVCKAGIELKFNYQTVCQIIAQHGGEIEKYKLIDKLAKINGNRPNSQQWALRTINDLRRYKLLRARNEEVYKNGIYQKTVQMIRLREGN